MSTRRLYDKEIADALALHVWQQLKTSLGLISSDVGSQFNLDAGDLSARLPAVRVALAGVEGDRDRARQAWLGTYRFEIHYLRAMADGEDAEETTRDACGEIAALFLAQAEWTLPTWTNQPGCNFRACYPTAVEVMQDEELQQIENGIGHGVVFVTVEADSFLYTP